MDVIGGWHGEEYMTTSDPVSEGVKEGSVPPVIAAPPTQAGVLVIEPAWTKVVGITSCVLGGLGVVSNCTSVIGGLMMPLFSKFAGYAVRQGPGGQANTMTPMLDSMAKWGVWIGLVSMVQMIVSGLLVWAGVTLLRRQRAARKLHLGYACGRIVVGLTMTVLTYFQQTAQLQQMQAQMGAAPGAAAPPVMVGGMMQGMAVIATVLGALWVCAYPVFLFVWFSRDVIREQVSKWE
jgi:hypothetical protein